MAGKLKFGSRPTWLTRLLRIAAILVVLTAAVELTVILVYGPRLWRRVPCWVSVNGKRAVEASVYRSGEGTLLVDLRHAPTHADVEGGGYLVQPFWNRVRIFGSGHYKVYGPVAVVSEMWLPSAEVRPDSYTETDPRLDANPDFVAFEGLEGDRIVVHGNVLLPWRDPR